MINLEKHTISTVDNLYKAFEKLNAVPNNLTLFVLNAENQMAGTLTDGDIRRGFLNGLTLSDNVSAFMKKKFSFLKDGNYDIFEIHNIKDKGVKLLPVLNDDQQIIKVLDFNKVNTILPIDVVLMAGGRGERLRPLTDSIPKPMLEISGKPIIEHNIDRLLKYGIENIFISIRYLGEKIESYFGNGKEKGINIEYLKEEQPLGTIGSLKLIEKNYNEHLLVMNSDLFTNIDYEDFYKNFLESGADFCIATVPYNVDVPYAILNLDNEIVNSLEEKPTYTYYANAGIYLFKSNLLKFIKESDRMDAPDFIQKIISEGYKVVKYPIIGYWIDIGKPEDFQKVLEIVKHV